MTTLKKITINLVAALAITGCGYKEGVSTGTQKAYLFFTGHVDQVIVSIDGSSTFKAKTGRDELYKIEPGKHIVKVMNDAGNVIVEREIYVGSGTSKEIEVHNVK